MSVTYIEEHLWSNFFYNLLELLQRNFCSISKNHLDKIVNFILTFDSVDEQVSIQKVS